MAEDIGHWLGLLPDWVQVVAIPLFVVLAFLFVPVSSGGDSFGAMIIEFMTRKSGEKDDEK